MTRADTARTVIGIIGNVISLFLFLSPGPTFSKICKKKSVQQFKPDPYIATVLNCALWVFYGMPFVHPDSILVVTINGTGVVIEMCYIIIFFIYCDWPKRRKIIFCLVAELMFMVVLVCLTLNFLHGTKDRSMLIGILATIFNVIMYVSPLTIMKLVITTKSVKYMPFYLAVTNFANGIIWFAYAFIPIDPYLLVPNGLGALSGLVQLILYGTYYKTTKWEDDDNNTQTQPTQIELQHTDPANRA